MYVYYNNICVCVSVSRLPCYFQHVLALDSPLFGGAGYALHSLMLPHYENELDTVSQVSSYTKAEQAFAQTAIWRESAYSPGCPSTSSQLLGASFTIEAWVRRAPKSDPNKGCCWTVVGVRTTSSSSIDIQIIDEGYLR